jgi:hypothetical protein
MRSDILQTSGPFEDGNLSIRFGLSDLHERIDFDHRLDMAGIDHGLAGKAQEPPDNPKSVDNAGLV